MLEPFDLNYVESQPIEAEEPIYTQTCAIVPAPLPDLSSTFFLTDPALLSSPALWMQTWQHWIYD